MLKSVLMLYLLTKGPYFVIIFPKQFGWHASPYADLRHVSQPQQVKKDKFVSQLEETRGFPRRSVTMIGQKTPPTEFDPRLA